MSTIDRAKKKTLATRKNRTIIHVYRFSIDTFTRYRYICIYIYFFVCVCVSFLHLSLLSHPIDYIRLYRAPQYDPKDLFSARA